MGAIKQGNGITFAQEPTTAKYDGMPRNAIDAGVFDFILPISDIAQWLARLSRHPLQNRNQELTRVLDDLANVASNVEVPVVALGSDLSARLFTPGTEKVVNINQSDIGLPVPGLNLKLLVDNLEQACQSW